MEIEIIIVNWNTKDLLKTCLSSLPDGLGCIPYRAWVVDNGSQDGSVDMVRHEFPSVKLIENKKNMGFAKANNQALSQTTAKFILLLNSDSVLTKGSAERLWRFLQDHPKAGMVGPRMEDRSGRLQHTTYPPMRLGLELLRLVRAHHLLPKSTSGRLFSGSFWAHNEDRTVGRLTGACLMMPREAIKDVGLLDESFYFYGEVHDWCLRLWRKGWQVWFCHDARVIHTGGGSAVKRWRFLEKRRRVLEANHLLLKKHFSFIFREFWYLVQFLSNVVSIIFRKINGDLSDQEGQTLRWETVWLLDRLGLFRFKEFLKDQLVRSTAAHELFIRSFRREWNVSASDLGRFRQEAEIIERQVHEKWRRDAGAFVHTGMMDLSEGRFLYMMVRALKPLRVMETGVANGASSTFLLHALDANGKGELFSLDLPVTDEGETFIPRGKSPGWLIPDRLRNRWQLTIGDTWKELPPLLERAGELDIFIHDSDHSYDAMAFEYSAAWPFIKEGGWLVSDDVYFNAAFEEWALINGSNPRIWARRLGLFQKKKKPMVTG